MGVLDGWRFCPICGEAIEKVEDRAECHACGYVGYANPVPGAEAVCLDGDGRVTLDEITVLIDQFFNSDDPQQPGNWFFGPF